MEIKEPQTAMTAQKLREQTAKGKQTKIMTIVHVTDDSNSRKQYALLFEESDDRLYLNVTNLRTMISKFGNNSDNWIGEKIELGLVKVDVDGVLKSGVRVL